MFCLLISNLMVTKIYSRLSTLLLANLHYQMTKKKKSRIQCNMKCFRWELEIYSYNVIFKFCICLNLR